MIKIVLLIFLLFLFFILRRNSLLAESFDSIDPIEQSNNYYKLIFTDDKNIRYQIVSLSQISNLYKNYILHHAAVNNKTKIDSLLKNFDDSINDMNGLMKNIKDNNNVKYIPRNDILFAVKEFDVYNTLLINNASSIIFHDIIEPLYYNNNIKIEDKTRQCSETEYAKLYIIGNMLTITCIKDPINTGLNTQYVNYDTTNNTINNMYVDLYNITGNNYNFPIMDLYEIILTPTEKNIKILKESISL